MANIAAIEANKKTLAALQAEIEEARPIATLKKTLQSVAQAQPLPDLKDQKFKPVKLLMGHFGKLYGLDWGSDNTTVLTAAQDGSLIMWNALSSNKLEVINLRSSWVMSCAMSESRRMTASGGLDNLVTIYKLPDGGPNPSSELKAHRELEGHTGYISGSVFLDDSKMLSSSGDKTCRLWDIEKNTVITQFHGHIHDVMGVSRLGESDLIVTGSVDCTAKVWDHRADMKSQNVLTFVGHDSDINAVTALNENTFATGSDDFSMMLHDIRSYGPVQHYKEDKIIVGISSVAVSSSGRFLFGGYDDQEARCWETLTGNQVTCTIKGHSNRVSCLGVNKAGTALATGGWDFAARIWC